MMAKPKDSVRPPEEVHTEVRRLNPDGAKPAAKDGPPIDLLQSAPELEDDQLDDLFNDMPV